jgi:uncharacterized protein with HEPN domain
LLIRNLEILGEAASRISQEMRQTHPEIPWRDMADMCNRLVHAYFDIDINVVWRTVQEALPSLLEQFWKILDEDPAD